MASSNQLKNTLEKLEDLFHQLGYSLRKEKGNFRTGACIIQNSKVIVLNKFATDDTKVQSLIDLLLSIEVDENKLSDKSRSFLYSLKQTQLVI